MNKETAEISKKVLEKMKTSNKLYVKEDLKDFEEAISNDNEGLIVFFTFKYEHLLGGTRWIFTLTTKAKFQKVLKED